MSKRVLFTLWGCLFIICAGLGFIPAPAGVLRGVLTGLSLVFFLPPAVLLYGADKQTARLIRNLAALSLGLTLLTLIASVVTAVLSERIGNMLHGFLVVVSSPMICSGYWVLSLFCWACVLMVSLKKCK